ncbi:DUF4465 domain-containing protein [Lewinella sp. LCG006]|uniref:T9SS type A sorting domain-containing protein n=1 Tax=Lewinella sp. LCG006 TaxID=3231911 RepID=UPI00346167A1
MKNNLLFIALFCAGALAAQTTTDFENFGLTPGEFINQTPDGAFVSGNVSLNNFYDEVYDYWDGWAISATTDNVTPGFMNQYSSASGAGANGSATYALTYAFTEQRIQLTGDAAGAPVIGMYVNNSTFAYLNMLNGGAPGKRFGGETGDDPDFFLLTIQGELAGERTEEVIEFYLADYRFADNSQDYIVTDWTLIDLTSLGNVDHLILSLSSSDNGDFGMNTPAYVCVDDITTSDMPLNVRDQQLDWNITLYPNPAHDYLQLEWPLSQTGTASIFNAQGQLVKSVSLAAGANSIAIETLPSGNYLLRFTDGNAWNAQRFIKL